jgi:uncharacterized protein (DUF305 family)
MALSSAVPTTRDARWRLVGVIAILAVTALAVALTRGIGNAQPPSDAPAAGELGVTDEAFLQLMITMDTSALALFVLLQNDSPTLAGVSTQILDSHRAELVDLRVVLFDGKVTEDSSAYQGRDLPGIITGDSLVEVHQASGAERDVMAIELMYQHLTQSVVVARSEEQSGTNAAAKALASRIEGVRSAQLALLGELPTTAPA